MNLAPQQVWEMDPRDMATVVQILEKQAKKKR